MTAIPGDGPSPGTIRERDPRPVLLAAPMSPAQWVAVAVTLLISATDGYDILAASFAAPSFAVQWRLTHGALGVILAVNLIGLGFGALFVSPLADRAGRRATILGCLLVVSVSMLLSAVSTTPVLLGLTRLTAGVGIGGMVGATLALATECANLRNRPLTAAVISVGLPLGGLFGAASAALLLRDHSWRSIFVSGGVITLAITALSAFLLPESVDYLIGRSDGRSLLTLNRVLRRFGQPELTVLPFPGSGPAGPAVAVRTTVFGRELRATTLAMIVLNFTQMMPIFFFVSWLPQIVADLSFSPATAAGVSLFQNAFGIVGALLVGWLARRWPIVPLAVATMIGTSLSILLFSFLPHDLALLKAGAGLEGFMALGCSAGIYGAMAQAFPAASRSTGTGFAYAFGRFGSIVAAVLPGVLFTRGWSLSQVAGLMIGVSVVGAATFLIWNAAIGLPARAAPQPPQT